MAAAVAAHSTGIPIMRSLPFLYPDNQQVITCDDEYLFGPDLLVAPVHHEGTMRSVTFPPGRWTHLWDGYIVEGPVTREIAAPLDDIPVFLRAGAIIPVQLNNELVWGASMSQQQGARGGNHPPDRARNGNSLCGQRRAKSHLRFASGGAWFYACKSRKPAVKPAMSFYMVST